MHFQTQLQIPKYHFKNSNFQISTSKSTPKRELIKYSHYCKIFNPKLIQIQISSSLGIKHKRLVTKIKKRLKLLDGFNLINSTNHCR